MPWYVDTKPHLQQQNRLHWYGIFFINLYLLHYVPFLPFEPFDRLPFFFLPLFLFFFFRDLHFLFFLFLKQRLQHSPRAFFLGVQLSRSVAQSTRLQSSSPFWNKQKIWNPQKCLVLNSRIWVIGDSVLISFKILTQLMKNYITTSRKSILLFFLFYVACGAY